MSIQESLFSEKAVPPAPPATRYQGSKLKLLDWIWEHISRIEFESVLDGFGGTGCVSHFLKGKGKKVVFNDLLVSNYLSAKALIENSHVRLDPKEINRLAHKLPGFDYDNLIERTFDEVYFTAEENVWLDTVTQNIPRMEGEFEQALAYHALFQACISKRPYNLFHRKNLYMRTAEVERSFGNKTTWDRPFEQAFRDFLGAANASVFEGEHACRALNLDIEDVPTDFDLVYLDPPYVNHRGQGVDYYDFYHFLEGLADYGNWERRIDMGSKHRRLTRRANDWIRARSISDAFDRLFERIKPATVVLSYRSDGTPSIEELEAMMRKHWSEVEVILKDGRYKYVLSTNNKSTEALLIGRV